MYESGYDDYWSNFVSREFGRRRGGLWRSEKDYYGVGMADAMDQMKAVASHVKDSRQTVHKASGMSGDGGFMFLGSIPLHIVLCHPELRYDEKAIMAFFKDQSKFALKGV